jgi:NADP-dependent 3-hydroxy acid dehydrogenase YdfG
MIDTNVKGLVYVTQNILPVMKANNRGHIINVGSIAGLQAYPNGSIYCASKHAVDAISNSLRMELVASPIRVSAINPGLVDTEFSSVRFHGDQEKAKSVYKGIKPLTAEDMAEIIVFTANRPEHVQIADMLVLPTNQASVYHIHRE